MSEFLNEFYVMDVVVLNGALSPTAAVDEEKQNVGEREADPDGVVTDYCVGLFSVFSGEDAIGWPHVYLAGKSNRRLALAKSAQKYSRCYANGCHHYRLPDTCWMIDPVVSHCVNIIVDLATVCQCENRQPGVMIRNVLLMDTVDDDANQCKKFLVKMQHTFIRLHFFFVRLQTVVINVGSCLIIEWRKFVIVIVARNVI